MDARLSLVLLSGGPDSATLLKWGVESGHANLHALYLRSGHATDDRELANADIQAAGVNAKLEVIDISHVVAALGGQRILIHSEANIMPFGNAIALSIATTYALRIGARSILIGLHADDAEESAEYRRPFIDAIEALARSTQGDLAIVTPFLEMTKVGVFALGARLGVNYAATWSCIRPTAKHCGYCGACRARAAAFQTAGLSDPTEYESAPMALTSIGSH